jgi:hypothetical protein
LVHAGNGPARRNQALASTLDFAIQWLSGHSSARLPVRGHGRIARLLEHLWPAVATRGSPRGMCTSPFPGALRPRLGAHIGEPLAHPQQHTALSLTPSERRKCGAHTEGPLRAPRSVNTSTHCPPPPSLRGPEAPRAKPTLRWLHGWTVCTTRRPAHAP